MDKFSLKHWTLYPLAMGLVGWFGFAVVGSMPCVAQSPHPGSWGSMVRKPSMTERLTSPIKQGWNKLSSQMTAPVKPAGDPVGLSSEAKPSAELFTAMGLLHEQSNDYSKAVEQYQRALQHTPDYLGALLGYARLQDRLGRADEALKFYARAAQSHPKNPAVYNNLALFQVRQGRLDEAVGTLGRAAQLEPANAKYRNNLATVLVEMGRNRQAFEQLCSVHPPAIAYYNLGYLLKKKGQIQAAGYHFAMAARLDPTLMHAKRELAQLGTSPVMAQRPTDPHSRPDARPAQPAPQATPTVPHDAAPKAEFRPLPNTLPPNRRMAVAGQSGVPENRAPAVGSPPNVSPGGTANPEFHMLPPAPPRGGAPMPAEIPLPRRLPPIASQPTGPQVPPMPPMTYDRPPTAPMPVPMAPMPSSPDGGPAFHLLPPL